MSGLAFAGVLLALAVLGLNWLIRRSLAAPRVPEVGEPVGLPWQAVRIATARGRSLFGWFIPAGERAPALAIVHGWGGNAELMLPLAAPLHRAGYALLFFDARCHGRSDGDSFASLPRFAEDLGAAVDWLRDRPEVVAERVGVLGHSVGAGAALLLASRRDDLAAAVSLSAFAHPAAMMRRWLAAKGLPYRPLGAYVLWYVQRVIGHRFDDIAPCRTIARVGCPVLIAHGHDDATVPVSDAEQIHASRGAARARLLLMPGGHDEYPELARHLGALIGFLDEAMGLRAGAGQLFGGPGGPSGSPQASDHENTQITKGEPVMPINQESVWTKRYQDAGEEYLFGTEPNRFLAHRAELLQDGRTAL